MTEGDRSFVIRGSVCVLSFCIVAMVCTMLGGLFFNVVDNKQIFGILGPMSNQISGALTSILSGLIAYRAGTEKGKT